MAVGASAWSAIFDAVTPAAAGTAKTIGTVTAAANRAIKVTEASIGFIGALGTAKPCLVELCRYDVTSAGAGSSAVTPAADDGSDAQTVQATAAKGYTTEPTALVSCRRWRVHPQNGQVVQLPLGREVKSAVGKGFAMRVTFETGETTTNMDGYLGFEE